MLQMLANMFIEIVIGKYSAITSGILGLGSSICLLIVPVRSFRWRQSALHKEQAEGVLDAQTIEASDAVFLKNDEDTLAKEQVWTVIGVVLLALSFTVLIIGEIAGLILGS